MLVARRMPAEASFHSTALKVPCQREHICTTSWNTSAQPADHESLIDINTSMYRCICIHLHIWNNTTVHMYIYKYIYIYPHISIYTHIQNTYVYIYICIQCQTVFIKKQSEAHAHTHTHTHIRLRGTWPKVVSRWRRPRVH